MSNTLVIGFLLVVILLLLCNKISEYVKWSNTPLKNFQFYHLGKKYWFSRPIAILGFIFCKDEDENWYVLATQRGKSKNLEKFKWNACGGYLDYDETDVQALQRELLDISDISLDQSNLTFYDVKTEPSILDQIVEIRYFSKLNGLIGDYKFNSENVEPNEILDVQWIPVNNLDDYSWGFNHNEVIREIFNNKIV